MRRLCGLGGVAGVVGRRLVGGRRSRAWVGVGEVRVVGRRG